MEDASVLGSWVWLIGAVLVAAAVVLAPVALIVTRRRARRRRSTLMAVAADEPATAAYDVVSEPGEHQSERSLKTIIVTGCDSVHYDLVLDLLTSLTDAGRDGLTVGFIHIGDGEIPPAIVAAADCVVQVEESSPLSSELRGLRLAYLKIKARLPEFFPGYDIYVWLDGDTWVQNRVGLDQIIHSTRFAELCAHPELDPNYYRERIPSNRMLDLYQAHYGAGDAARHVRLPEFNAGVFGAMSGSPLWDLWREALAEVHWRAAETRGLRFSDQTPLHRLIVTGKISVHPLRAINNWLVHAATPSISLAQRRLLTPTYPHEEINIVHLTGSTKRRAYRFDASGREISLRYGSIKALFAEVAAKGSAAAA